MHSKRLEIVRQRIGRVPRLVATAEPVRAQLLRLPFFAVQRISRGTFLNFPSIPLDTDGFGVQCQSPGGLR